jgi:hypothetical protein
VARRRLPPAPRSQLGRPPLLGAGRTFKVVLLELHEGLLDEEHDEEREAAGDGHEPEEDVEEAKELEADAEGALVLFLVFCFGVEVGGCWVVW